jgi:hypothetical protein
MKKLALVFIAAVTLASCSNVLDKKVNLKTAKDDYAKIKEEYKDKYTAAELAALSNEMGKQVFGGGTKTYRELLDTIHAKRIRYEADLKVYTEAAKKLTDAISLTVTKSGMSKGPYNIGDDFSMLFDVKNTTSKNIAAYDGTVVVESLTGTELGRFRQETSKTLPAGQTLQDGGTWSVFSNVQLLQEATTEKLKFTWTLRTIVFEDGTKLVTPIKPTNPLGDTVNEK